jgi:hypothetical protein
VASPLYQSLRRFAREVRENLTGEILSPNARGRDPIVTRILWLRGLEKCNLRAFALNIYIHGTLIGRPASYGCIRMRSRDVVALFSSISVGTKIAVMNQHLHNAIAVAGASLETGSLRFASY